MLFSSWLYVGFLLVTLVLYWTMPQRWRIGFLLLASYVFYASWSPPFGLIYAPVIFLDSVYFYALSRAMVRWPQHKKGILIFGVVTELCLLAYFKYANFLAGTLEALMAWMQLPTPHWEFNVFLPLAISFTNFILISYLVDIYRGNEKPDPKFIRFATYVAFFPHLIAGPIVRAKELLHQFDTNPPFSLDRLAQGIHRFCCGLFIKVFVADIIAVYVNSIFNTPDLQGFNTNWIATYGFAIQIFCDFSGYTMMAQGSALMFGYTLPENFNAPYFSKNISEFWKRWHISLSTWIRDYLYIPLGGNRNGVIATYCNLLITMAIAGLWHGANWTFVIWGIYQGVLLCAHRVGQTLNINRFLPKPVAVLLTFHMVCIGWVFFRAQSLSEAFRMLGQMFNPAAINHAMASTAQSVEAGLMHLSSESALAMIILFFAGHLAWRKLNPLIFQHPVLREGAMALAYCSLLYFGVSLVGAKTQQFIYFQF